jgi:hypothetical protein
MALGAFTTIVNSALVLNLPTATIMMDKNDIITHDYKILIKIGGLIQ